MSSFFTIPGGPKKRKRTSEANELPKKKLATNKPTSKPPKSKPPPPKPQRDESISGSEDESASASHAELSDAEIESESEGSVSGEETAAARRLRLAEQYLSNIRSEVADNEIGFDAAEIDRDLIAERLREDVAESKGKLYRHLAEELDFSGASHSLFGWDGLTFTSVAACEPWAYTVGKDLGLGKWRIQDLPKDQFPRKEKKGRRKKKKVQKPPPPPRKKPTQVAFVRGNKKKAKDNSYRGHTDVVLTVAASQDGKFVVTGGRDRKIIVWEAETMRHLRTFTQHRDAVTGLAFRRGTNQLYSSSKDRTVKVWSLDELAYVETLFGHQDEVVDVAALAQERCISVGARDRTARLWKVVEETQLVFRGGGGEKKSKHKPSAGPSPALECSMDRVAMIDEEMFVTGGDNGSLSLWIIHKKKPIFTMPLCHGMDPPLAPDEASAEQYPEVDIVPAPQPRWITALTTLPYSDVILSGSWDGYVRVWKVSEDKKKIERVGVLGRGSIEEEPVLNGVNGHVNGNTEESTPARGVVNDIAVFEPGERGRDGVCIIAAVGKEHRLGRWKKVKGKNGGVVFEVPRLEKMNMNGVNGADAMDHD